MMDAVLTASGLCKNYGGTKALDGLSLTVPRGAIYGLIGRNGAGKTTLIRIICGLSHADGGTCVLRGIDGDAHPRVGAIAGTPAMYANMSARENMCQQCRILGITDFDGAMEKLALVGLENTGRKKARHFSQGMRQKLGIAMALLSNPELVVLDEPANGLDPQGIIGLRQLITTLNREQNITFLVSSHMLDELSRIATHYGFIDRGRVVREATTVELEMSLKKTMRVSVSNTDALARALDGMNISYSVLSDGEVDIHARMSATRLTEALSKENCELYSCVEHEESLEAYFVDLVGGEEHA